MAGVIARQSSWRCPPADVWHRACGGSVNFGRKHALHAVSAPQAQTRWPGLLLGNRPGVVHQQMFSRPCGQSVNFAWNAICTQFRRPPHADSMAGVIARQSSWRCPPAERSGLPYPHAIRPAPAADGASRGQGSPTDVSRGTDAAAARSIPALSPPDGCGTGPPTRGPPTATAPAVGPP
jgi:hypothetical protein